MKLSQLVHYREMLDEYIPQDTRAVLQGLLNPVRHVVNSNEIQLAGLAHNMDQHYEQLQQDLDKFDNSLICIRDRIQQLIGNIEPSYLAASYRLYEQEMCWDSVDHILNRRFNLTTEAETYIKGRIKLKTDWKRPGMIIRPGLESWISDLVALDPLYLVDTDHELLKPGFDRFNENYQQRLRLYTIQESTEQPMLSKLPNGQFGYVLVYNFFNYKPFELVRGYLTEIYQKLAPGGSLNLTINDCDRTGGVALAERSFMCYTPSSMVCSFAESIGYEVKETYHVDAACTWIEMSKPGTKPSLRGGQTLARVNAKGENEVDNPYPVSYTDDEVKALIGEAIELGIERPGDVAAHSPRILDYLIRQQRKNKE
jgi:hypothetical protein